MSQIEIGVAVYVAVMASIVTVVGVDMLQAKYKKWKRQREHV